MDLLEDLLEPLLHLLHFGGAWEGSFFSHRDQSISDARLASLVAREDRRLKVAGLVALERDRRAGKLSQASFMDRYGRLAHRVPGEDPAAWGTYGPNTAAAEAFLDQVFAMRDWARATQHMRNLQHNPALRDGLVPAYRAALETAVGSARLSAAAALERSIAERVPEEHVPAWRLVCKISQPRSTLRLAVSFAGPRRRALSNTQRHGPCEGEQSPSSGFQQVLASEHASSHTRGSRASEWTFRVALVA